MTTTLHNPTTATTATRRSGFSLLPAIIGFIFAFRACLTILWFQDEPQIGSIVTVALSFSLLIAAVLFNIGRIPSIPSSSFRTPTLRWITAFLALNLISLFWTAGPLDAALSFWAAWVADVATIWFVLRDESAQDRAASIMKGFVWGGSAVALVAWILPTMPHLRLGDDVFFYPNNIGMICVLGTLMAFYLAGENTMWRWPVAWLTLTLIRSISKTSFVAFLIAMTFYLFRDRTLSRATRIKIAFAGIAIVATLSGVLAKYVDLYTESVGASALTGRTTIWATTWEYAVKKPLFGYGFYAYRFVIPPFGIFEATHAHNEFLQQFFALGTLGIILVIAIYWSIFRQIRRAPSSRLKTLAATLLIFAILHGIADALPFDLSFPLWLMAMLSILLVPASASSVATH
ncbi:MAG TPA: O-antigen ligase family protein [Edaphobacter sp.]|jgi:exopolysaccharide production protein ExoQ|nr:O-antigen ligase family protein [Edaphobacter sp.]